MNFIRAFSRVCFDEIQTYIIIKINYYVINYHSLCASRFRDKTDRTSDTNLRASNTGNRLSNAVSVGSLNHDLMGIALSEKKKFKKMNQKM